MAGEVTKETHYVAQLKIERVDRVVTVNNANRRVYEEPTSTESKREISEVTQMVIKAEDLERLLDKLGKHIQLVEDE